MVDCDLRKPRLHNSFDVPNAKGLIDFCEGGADLDNVLIRTPSPTSTSSPSGGRSPNPTHILNSAEFGRMIAELRGRYDRVVIDTPPLAPVSDAMAVLPHVDGSVFTLRFSFVRAKAARDLRPKAHVNGGPMLRRRPKLRGFVAQRLLLLGVLRQVVSGMMRCL